MGLAIDSWVADTCRVSLFAVGQTPEVATIFEAIAGQPPTTTSSDRRLAQTHASGIWKGGTLQITSTPGRVDLIRSPEVPEVPEVVFLPGLVSDVIEELVSAARDWLEGSKIQMIRVALGARCLHKCETVHATYALLDDLLSPVEVNYQKFREMTFSGNFPALSHVSDGLALNRISTWRSVTLNRALFSISGGKATNLESNHYAFCELDYSTDAERTEPLESGAVPRLIRELADSALNTLTEGV